jgi:hypothetical protein
LCAARRNRQMTAVISIARDNRIRGEHYWAVRLRCFRRDRWRVISQNECRQNNSLKQKLHLRPCHRLGARRRCPDLVSRCSDALPSTAATVSLFVYHNDHASCVSSCGEIRALTASLSISPMKLSAQLCKDCTAMECTLSTRPNNLAGSDRRRQGRIDRRVIAKGLTAAGATLGRGTRCRASAGASTVGHAPDRRDIGTHARR